MRHCHLQPYAQRTAMHADAQSDLLSNTNYIAGQSKLLDAILVEYERVFEAAHMWRRSRPDRLAQQHRATTAHNFSIRERSLNLTAPSLE